MAYPSVVPRAKETRPKGKPDHGNVELARPERPRAAHNTGDENNATEFGPRKNRPSCVTKVSFKRGIDCVCLFVCMSVCLFGCLPVAASSGLENNRDRGGERKRERKRERERKAAAGPLGCPEGEDGWVRGEVGREFHSGRSCARMKMFLAVFRRRPRQTIKSLGAKFKCSSS